MKTILTICCHVDLCGADLSMLTALKGLKNKGYKIVVLLTRNGRIEEQLKKMDIEYYIVPQNGCATNTPPKINMFLLRQLYYLLFFIKHEFICDIKLLKFIRNFNQKPDIIYTNTVLPTTGIFLSLYYKVPHVMHIRELTDDDFHFTYYIGKKLYLKILDRTLTCAICISKAVQDKFTPYLKGKTKLIYNGVPEIKETKFITESNDSVIKILFVGRLSKEKGVIEVVKAIKTLKEKGYNNIRLDIWGEGQDKDQVETYINKNQLEKFVEMKGYSPSNLIPRHKYDIAVMSSPHEAFGRVTVEYMMAGLAVIGYNGGATPEIIKHKESGLLYNSQEELIKYIQLLIENKETRLTIGKKGQERAYNYFSEQKYMNNINNLFDSILKNKNVNN